MSKSERHTIPKYWLAKAQLSHKALGLSLFLNNLVLISKMQLYALLAYSF